MLFLPHRLCLTARKLSAALTDEEQGNQLLRRSPIKEETTASLQRSVLVMCLAGRVEMSNTTRREAVRLNECEGLGLQVSQNVVLEVSNSAASPMLLS